MPKNVRKLKKAIKKTKKKELKRAKSHVDHERDWLKRQIKMAKGTRPDSVRNMLVDTARKRLKKREKTFESLKDM
jgi:hypothetical protein